MNYLYDLSNYGGAKKTTDKNVEEKGDIADVSKSWILYLEDLKVLTTEHHDAAELIFLTAQHCEDTKIIASWPRTDTYAGMDRLECWYGSWGDPSMVTAGLPWVAQNLFDPSESSSTRTSS